MKSTLVPFVFATLAAGCAFEPPPERTAPPTPSLTEDPVSDPEPADTTRGRDRRRMDLDQLSASIERVTGGLKWKGLRGPDRFVELAATLGKPDYTNATQEDLNPSLLFQKFLDDAASDICQQLVVRESTADGERVLRVSAGPGDRFEDNPDAVRADLRQALLRFHGRTVPADSTELDAWIWLFRTTTEVSEAKAADGRDPDEAKVQAAWRAVCVALITHPDFTTW